MMAAGLYYRDSWVSATSKCVFSSWRPTMPIYWPLGRGDRSDLIEFEIIPVIPSSEAHAKALGEISCQTLAPISAAPG